MAEKVRFELTERASRSVDFESTAFDHSATSPRPLELFHYTRISGRVNHMGPKKTQVATALSRIKRVIVQVKLILIVHPSGAAENVKKLSWPHVKNLACGFGGLVQWGGRQESNPYLADPQSAALPLSYGRHVFRGRLYYDKATNRQRGFQAPVPCRYISASAR